MSIHVRGQKCFHFPRPPALRRKVRIWRRLARLWRGAAPTCKHQMLHSLARRRCRRVRATRNRETLDQDPTPSPSLGLLARRQRLDREKPGACRCWHIPTGVCRGTTAEQGAADTHDPGTTPSFVRELVRDEAMATALRDSGQLKASEKQWRIQVPKEVVRRLHKTGRLLWRLPGLS